VTIEKKQILKEIVDAALLSVAGVNTTDAIGNFLHCCQGRFGVILFFNLLQSHHDIAHRHPFGQVSHLSRANSPQILLKETRSGCRQW